jgi:hypothetical protein
MTGSEQAYIALRDDAGDFGSWLIGVFAGEKAEEHAVATVQEDADLHAGLPEGEHAPVSWQDWHNLPTGGRVRDGLPRFATDTMYRIVAAPLNVSMAG